MADCLCYGDSVSLYSDEQGGYVFSNHSSSVFNEVAVSNGGEKKTADENVMTFEVVPPTRYQISSHYRHSITHSSNPNGPDSANPNQTDCQAEVMFNTEEIKRQRGRPVCYGQTVQFRHRFTNKYIQVSSNTSSHLETQNGSVTLQAGDSIDGQFRIWPKHKHRKDGDWVTLGEEVIFESISCPSQYLHVSRDTYNHEMMAYDKHYELNMSASQSTFLVLKKSSPLMNDDQRLQNGDVVQFFHNKIHGYLVAEGSFNRGIKDNDGYIELSSTVRLLHLCTRMYLCVDSDRKVTLTSDPENVGAHFQLVSVDDGTDYVTYKTCYCLENFHTGLWIHTTHDEYNTMQKDTRAGSRKLESLPVSMAKLYAVKALNHTSSREHFNEKQYEDLFVLEKVSETDYQRYTFVAGMVPYLFKKHIATTTDVQVSRNIVKCFYEMINFMMLDGKPMKSCQKLFRNLGVIDRMLEILNHTFQPENIHMCTIFTLVYDLLRAYVTGQSRKNKAHVARHIYLFFSHFSHKEGHVQQHAADMVVEFTQDNMDVVARITRDDMTKLVDYIRQDKEYRFLKLMDKFCVCQGIPIEDNQQQFISNWLKSETRNCLLFTKLEKTEGKHKAVMVTVDNVNKIELGQLTKDQSNQAECQFFYSQLRTFEQLCYGRNENAIKTLTSDRNYITAKEARTCLTNTELPEDLRALYCELIIALFINTEQNQAMVHPIEELYLHGLDTHPQDGGKVSSNEQKLGDFVNGYLSMDPIHTSIDIGTNKLTAQVLALLHHLTLIGKHSMNELTISHLVQLLNGKTDTPQNVSVMELQKYRQKDRFKKTDSTEAVVGTKIQCLMVLETYFDNILKKRLKKLIEKFDKIVKQCKSNSTVPEIIDPTIKPEESERFLDEATGILQKLLSETAEFPDCDLPAILVDLTHYEYESLVSKAVEMYYSHFTAIPTLLKHAERVQILRKNDIKPDCEYVRTNMAVLKKRLEGKVSADDASNFIDILDEFARLCTLRQDSGFLTTLQNALMSHGVIEVIMKILTSNELQDVDPRTVPASALQLVERLTWKNERVQMIIFNKLDVLLAMKENYKFLLPVLKSKIFDSTKLKASVEDNEKIRASVFGGNFDTCRRIRDGHVQTLVMLLALESDANDEMKLFDILQMIMKPDRLGLPLRRNQNLVMRYMADVRLKVANLFGMHGDVLINFTVNSEPTKMTYFLSTVDLMASCAQNGDRENKAVLCKLFDVQELLKILTFRKMSPRMRPWLRALTYGYIEGFKGDKSGTDNLLFTTEKTLLENLLKKINKSLRDVCKADIEVDDKFLHGAQYERSNYARSTTDIGQVVELQLDAVVPFCQYLCTWMPPERVADVHEEMKKVAEEFKNFLEKLKPEKLPSPLRIQLIDCMKSLNKCVHSEIDMGVLEQTYTSQVVEEVTADEDQRINQQYQTFIRNLRLAWNGSQMMKSVKETWTEIQRRKFEFVSLKQRSDLKPLYKDVIGYRNTPRTQTFYLTEKIITGLRFLRPVKAGGEIVYPKPELKQSYMKALQATILRQINKLPDDFDVFLQNNRKKLDRLKTVQMDMVNHGAVECALQDLSPELPDEHLKESLHLLICLLFHGNRQSQDAISAFFVQRPDVLVIQTLHRKIEYFRDYALVVEPVGEALAGTFGSETKVKVSDLGPSSDTIPLTPMKVHIRGLERGMSRQSRIWKNQVSPEPGSMDKEPLEVGSMQHSAVDRDVVEMTSLILEFIAATCQNQHTQLQNYFKEQHPAELSTNFITVLVDVVDTLHTRIDSNLVTVAIQIYHCLTQILSGNTGNKSVVLNSKVCEQTNFMLYDDNFGDCTPMQIYKLKKSVGSFWRCMTEDTCVTLVNDGNLTADLSTTAIEYLDSEVILQVLRQTTLDRTQNKTCKDIRDLVTSVGFQYCQLLERKLYKLPSLSIDDLLKTDEDRKMYEFFSEAVRSVEVLKDDTLHKVFFRVKDKNAVSGDIKERIKYDVDRSSHVEKIQDLMSWSNDTTDYARNRWRICRVWLGKLLIYSWVPVNYIMLLLTVAILIMIGIDYENDSNSKVYEVDRSFGVKVAVYVLGGIHNFLSLLIVIGFILLNQPQFLGMTRLFHGIRGLKVENASRKQQFEERTKASRLQINAYGPHMFYYILFLSASSLGTALHGFTFAFCLLQIFELNRYLKRIGRAVMSNGKYLGMISVLGVIVLYIYAVVAFLFLRRSHITNADGHHCNTMPQCFVTMLHHGLVGTTYEMIDYSSVSSISTAVGIGVFNLSFFILITILLLYIVFAILVDGFLHLKQKMRRAKDDFKAVCFICGRPNADFIVASKDYSDHVRTDHNIWDYIYFFIHLDTTAISEYSALENYVYTQIREGKHDFLPMDRAICLEETDKVKSKMMMFDREPEGGLNSKMERRRKKFKKLPSLKGKSKTKYQLSETPKPVKDKAPKKRDKDKPRRPIENRPAPSIENRPTSPVEVGPTPPIEVRPTPPTEVRPTPPKEVRPASVSRRTAREEEDLGPKGPVRRIRVKSGTKRSVVDKGKTDEKQVKSPTDKQAVFQPDILPEEEQGQVPREEVGIYPNREQVTATGESEQPESPTEKEAAELQAKLQEQLDYDDEFGDAISDQFEPAGAEGRTEGETGGQPVFLRPDLPDVEDLSLSLM